jgi:serine protease Do
VLAGLLSSTAIAGFAIGDVSRADSSAAGAANSGAQPIQPAQPAQTLPDFSALVEHVRPAVVSVTNELKETDADATDSESGGGGGPGGMPFPFGFPGMPGSGQPQHPQAVEARGSGFIVDASGTIVTNNHVVKGAKSVTVTLDDGTTLPAKIVGTDPRTDLAVLRVHADHALPYIQLGDSSKAKVGEWVVAVGNPYGLGGTVTAGIVSARGRDLGDGPYDSFIQIDAPINRGNSGGPLFTQDGHVVGVNTAILSPTGGSIGIGFAIPSNTVKTVLADIERSGHVTRGYLGVEIQPVTPNIAAGLNLPSSVHHLTDGHYKGALIAALNSDGPAAHAGLKAGDVILAVNGQSISGPRDLAVAVAAIKPGDSAKLDVVTDGQAKNVNVQVGTLPSEDSASADDNGQGDQQKGIGLALAPLSPEMRSQLNVPDRTRGAVVANVAPGSPADKAGIQQGDVIVGVGSKAVTSPEQVAADIREALHHGDAVALRLFRDGHMAFVGVTTKDQANAG